MKKLVHILFILFSVSFFMNAQNTSIVEDLNAHKTGQGKITVYQDEAINSLLGTPIQSSKSINNATLMNQLNTTDGNTDDDKSQNFVKTRGFRIQVYSGSDQKRSKNEAQTRRNTIKSSFPNMEVTVTYNSPVWRVKAGNFKTREQASQALGEMKLKFPGFGREMYIINDVVKIPVD